MGKIGQHKFTKTECKAALKRVIAFRDEFNLTPNSAVKLDSWWRKTRTLCGSVGCLGGYACHSPLMKKFVVGQHKKFSHKYCGSEIYLTDFFGITLAQSYRFNLFEPRLLKEMTNKQEGLARLDKVIAYHNRHLE